MPEHDYVIDLWQETRRLLESVWKSKQRITTDFGEVSVVSREGLVTMKSQAGRDQDLADIRRLQELDR